jgi:hypothetical protein
LTDNSDEGKKTRITSFPKNSWTSSSLSLTARGALSLPLRSRDPRSSAGHSRRSSSQICDARSRSYRGDVLHDGGPHCGPRPRRRPQGGPVLLVGNHMLLGIELITLAAEFLRQKVIIVRGISHPLLFPNKTRAWSRGHDFFDSI